MRASVLGIAIILSITQLAPTARAVEYLEGSSGSDTIVYGVLVLRVYHGGCYGYAVYGPGICVFAKSGTWPYRGSLRSVQAWTSPDSYPLGLRGDSVDDGAADYIYPATTDWGSSYVYCGSYAGMYWYVATDYYFDGTGACEEEDADAEFDPAAQMEIWGDGDDVSLGADDDIYGWTGNDVLQGCGGADFVTGGAGADWVLGGYGGDTLTAGTCTTGTEYLVGGDYDTATDSLWGSDGLACENRMSGGPGSDLLTGSAADDILWGGAGDDDTLNGNQGDDELYGGDGSSDQCNGGEGLEGEGGDLCDCEPTEVDCER